VTQSNRAVLQAIEYHLPEARVTNDVLAEQFPEWTPARSHEIVGVDERDRATPGDGAGRDPRRHARDARRLRSRLLLGRHAARMDLRFEWQSAGQHWFEPSQAHHIREFRVPIFDLPRRFFCRIVFKTENKRRAPDRLREIVPARETPRRMPEFEYAPVAKPGDQ
jgi:hypothetical protein